ncbi:Crotonobetainyl-CoA:carnitine CoA-transferase CaiB [Mycolicibacterium rutilum]|uniref:Crotonobetainyl-CoA:carnitine CoA-transferase CaiB n=1 Tax=Mycolicibacterium rutilum TaxID=370526 RepID=A0A1H6KZ36_MYCRU|nr:CoA transferase [Mycolicibacterium rutilum]SEH79217.1 Crotonobetainyl-CoA:carnitine CoA-transferase CaiB [Mycolicibacterium rutilum]
MTQPAPTPLRDVRVVEISDRIAGAYCGKLLTDAGADVVTVEPPEGSALRRVTVTGAPLDEAADSPLFSYLNAGKRSRTELSGNLLAGADIVVLTGTAGSVDAAALLEASPRCVVVSITDFGRHGPWSDRPASEFTLQAASGLTGFRGDPAGPPISVGGEVGEYMAGAWAAYGALALRHRVRGGGPGGLLDLSVLEAITLMQSGEWLHSALLQVPPVRRSVEVPSIEPARDGYVGISMVTGQQWLDFAAMVECPELTEIPQLQFQIGRWDYRDWIRERIGPWLAGRTVEEIVELGQLFRLPLAPIGNGATIPQMDHLRERGVYVDNPAGFRQPRPPWLMSAAAPAPVRPAPTTGGGDAPWPPRSAAAPATPNHLPLNGIRVVDFTAFWAGPAATHALAAFGADVIKIESVQRPDGIRYSGGMRKDVDDWWEYSWVFHAMNTNKRSVTLDLQSERGRSLVLRLIAQADVVVENFSPRVMEQFGLDAETLLEANPRLVMLRMPAFGLDGPWRDRVGFAPTMEQIAGLAWVTGQPDGPPVAPRGACDPLAGAHAAFALLAALECTARTGTGQLVEVPMIETVLNVTAIQTIEYQVFGRVMERRGNRGHGPAIQDVYRCAGPDTWLAVTAGTEQQRIALAGLTGGTGDEVAAWLATRDAEEAAQTLTAAGVPAEVVISPSLAVGNPQLRHRGFFEALDRPSVGENLYPCPPFTRLDGAERWLRRPPPRLGQHNEEVLTGLCGVTPDELATLTAEGVIGTRPKGL